MSRAFFSVNFNTCLGLIGTFPRLERNSFEKRQTASRYFVRVAYKANKCVDQQEEGIAFTVF
jgi:hypothetical protein